MSKSSKKNQKSENDSYSSLIEIEKFNLGEIDSWINDAEDNSKNITEYLKKKRKKKINSINKSDISKTNEKATNKAKTPKKKKFKKINKKKNANYEKRKKSK